MYLDRFFRLLTGLPLLFYVVFLAVWAALALALAPVAALGAEQHPLTVQLCEPDRLNFEAVRCQERYRGGYLSEALCEGAVDQDGDGVADQYWTDTLHRLGDQDGDGVAEPGLFLTVRCPLRGYIVEVP